MRVPHNKRKTIVLSIITDSLDDSLVPRPPRPIGERRSGTNSW